MTLRNLVFLNADSKIIVRDYSRKVICKFNRIKDNWLDLLDEKGILDAKVIGFSIHHNKLYITI